MKVRISAVLSRQLEYPTGNADQAYPVIFQDVKTVDFDDSMPIGECVRMMNRLYPGAILMEVAVTEYTA